MFPYCTGESYHSSFCKWRTFVVFEMTNRLRRLLQFAVSITEHPSYNERHVTTFLLITGAHCSRPSDKLLCGSLDIHLCLLFTHICISWYCVFVLCLSLWYIFNMLLCLHRTIWLYFSCLLMKYKFNIVLVKCCLICIWNVKLTIIPRAQ